MWQKRLNDEQNIQVKIDFFFNTGYVTVKSLDFVVVQFRVRGYLSSTNEHLPRVNKGYKAVFPCVDILREYTNLRTHEHVKN